jgi:hypothetical protein
MALFFVILARRGRTLSRIVINHEKIHFAQQREMFYLPFLIFYGIEFLVRLAEYREWDAAYRNISFEREAFANDTNFAYLVFERKPYAWLKYL